MIEVAGTTQLSFMFPASRTVAYQYYCDMRRVVRHLSHIELVRAHTEQQFRMLYRTTELAAYRIRIYCDVQMELAGDQQFLRMYPIEMLPPIKPEAGFTSATTRGSYQSESRFFDEGEQTRIEYRLQLSAALPTPEGLSLFPERVVNAIAHSITNRRIEEIAQGFIEGSIAAFPYWLAQNRSRSADC